MEDARFCFTDILGQTASRDFRDYASFRTMAHRWCLPKVQKWEAKAGDWDIQSPDLLFPFLRTLPRPTTFSKELPVNKHGDSSELYKLKYADCITNNPVLYHGTTYKGVKNIIEEGFQESCLPGIHEFTTPGVYCADQIDGSLYYHATATRMTAPPHDCRVPYVRFLLLVEPVRQPKKISSYGECRQLVFNAGDLRLLEVHVYRGWHFKDCGEKVMHMTAEEDNALRSPGTASTPSPTTSNIMAGQHHEPPVIWSEYIYIDVDSANSRSRPYYFNHVTEVTTWTKPLVPYKPAEMPAMSLMKLSDTSLNAEPCVPVDFTTDDVQIMQINPAGQSICCLCDKGNDNSHCTSRVHSQRLRWWNNASSEERTSWVSWTTAKWNAAH